MPYPNQILRPLQVLSLTTSLSRISWSSRRTLVHVPRALSSLIRNNAEECRIVGTIVESTIAGTTLHLHLRPSSLRKGLRSNISMKTVALEDGTWYYVEGRLAPMCSLIIPLMGSALSAPESFEITYLGLIGHQISVLDFRPCFFILQQSSNRLCRDCGDLPSGHRL